MPPLVAIEKYCTADNPLQRLSWAGVSGETARVGQAGGRGVIWRDLI